MNNVKKIICIFAVLFSGLVTAKSVEYAYEDAYLKQAPAEIVQIADRAAEVVGFDQPFSVTMPTKAGMQINPINGFFAYGLHPLSQHVFFIINPEWFATLSSDEQIFLLGRGFMSTIPGFLYYLIKVLPYLFVLFSVMLALVLYWLMRFTPLAYKKWWLKALVVYVLLIVINLSLVRPFIQPNISSLLALKFDMNVIQNVIAKTGNKEAALQAFEKYNAGIQQEFDNGQLALQPYVGLFKKYADALNQQ